MQNVSHIDITQLGREEKANFVFFGLRNLWIFLDVPPILIYGAKLSCAESAVLGSSQAFSSLKNSSSLTSLGRSLRACLIIIIIIITKLPNFPIQIKREINNFQKAFEFKNYSRYCCVVTFDTNGRQTSASVTPGISNFTVKFSRDGKFSNLETQWTNTSDTRPYDWTSFPIFARELNPFVLKVKQSEATAILSWRLDTHHEAIIILPTAGQRSTSDTTRNIRIFSNTAVRTMNCANNMELTVYSPVVTICTVQWSVYVPYSGHYMYRTVVTICTAQWSLYVPHSGHYMYRIVVTICTA